MRSNEKALFLEPHYARRHAWLACIADVLNAPPRWMKQSDHAQLLRLVGLWDDSGRDWANDRFWRRSGESVDALQGRIQRAIHIVPVLLKGPAAKLHKPTMLPTNGDVVAFLIGQLVLDPDCGEFWGGRCRRCSCFYVRKTRGQRAYCSEECRSRRSGQEYKANQRETLRRKIVEIVERKCRDYAELPARQRQRIHDWKAWVADQASKELKGRKHEPRGEITAKWITRNRIAYPSS